MLLTRYAKGGPFSVKMVSKRVRGWISGWSLPVWNFEEYPPPFSPPPGRGRLTLFSVMQLCKWKRYRSTLSLTHKPFFIHVGLGLKLSFSLSSSCRAVLCLPRLLLRQWTVTSWRTLVGGDLLVRFIIRDNLLCRQKENHKYKRDTVGQCLRKVCFLLS